MLDVPLAPAMLASSARQAGEKPGVENKLGLAPPPLVANDLDMRDGHPADFRRYHKRGSHASAPIGAP